MTRPRKPWPRVIQPLPHPWSLVSHLGQVRGWWKLGAPDGALRIRWAARQSCARLRAERDAARQCFAEERETALEIREEQRAAERERDSAQRELEQRTAERDALHRFAQVMEQRADESGRELRALEWLHEQSDEDYPHDWFYRGTVVWTMSADGLETEHPSYAAAALALGWEGP